MLYSILYIFLALLGLGVLVFIHEMGHYVAAKRCGMRVEAFSIGFGKPIVEWERNGVKWRFCWLFFGGYVRIAGMDSKDGDPEKIADGFFGKGPFARIKVAFAGPLVNIVFAIVAFTLVWAVGGRTKGFSEFTHLIGFVDPNSELYEKGVRPGDKIVQYDGHKFESFKDLVLAGASEKKTTQIAGDKIDYYTGVKTPFNYTLPNYQDERLYRGISTIGIFSSAHYLIFNRLPTGDVGDQAPLKASGIQSGDRLLWADGELLFSQSQLSAVVNSGKSLLTVERGDERFLSRVPRILIDDLKLTPSQEAEIDDWRHEAGIKQNLKELYFIPYNLNEENVIEGPLAFFSESVEESVPVEGDIAPYERGLKTGDKIVAVDGMPVSAPYTFLNEFQTRKVQLIVRRAPPTPTVTWTEADSQFMKGIDPKGIESIAMSIGSSDPLKQSGDLILLNPVTPRPWNSFTLPGKQKERVAKELAEIQKIDDPKKREEALALFEEAKKKLMLGGIFFDKKVLFNPTPWTLFVGSFQEMWRTLSSLVTGDMSPKWLSGPVGIVYVMQQSWGLGIGEALYWLGLISLNLGFLNLLPLPVLDGGYILISLYEIISGKRIKAKTMEKMILPFVILLIAFFLYVTFNDMSHLFGR